jgi:hypothetical protein
MGGHLYASSTNQDTGLPNLSPRQRAQDKTIDIFVNALYWKTSETVDWAFTLKTKPNFVGSAYKTLAFDWDPGFRVGVGYNMHHDQWDTQFTYTWFQAQANDHASGSVTSGFLAARLSLLEPFQKGKIDFNLHYNMFDWDLGRSFLVSKSLSFRPFIGAKAGWINQRLRAKWTSPDYFAFEKVKNNFRGGGPKGGVDSQWILGNIERHVFSLKGTLAAAYLWGSWTLRDQFIDVFSTKTSIPMGRRNFGSLMLQTLMGFGWDFDFDKERSHFALNVSYEIQDWLNHFQVFSNASGTQNADLILQGLTVDVRFDF